MHKLLTAYLIITLVTGVGGSIYDKTRQMALSAKRVYQHNQISYAEFTKSMTNAKPRRPSNKN